jgi:hypothetical protein
MANPRSSPQLVTGGELFREFSFLTPWALFRLRKKRLIPYIKVGHRTIMYDP